MSLATAVLEVAEQLEGEGKAADKPYNQMFRLYAKMLRTAVKAAEPVAEAAKAGLRSASSGWATGGAGVHVEDVNPEQAALAELLMAKHANKAKAQEATGERMVELVGGPGVEDHTAEMYPVNPAMPEGAKCFVGNGLVYQLRDGRLHYDADATKYHQEMRRKEMGV